MTINPVYTYKDATGQTVKTGLLEKDKIPKGVDRKIHKLNICDNRIRSLKGFEDSKDNPDEINMHPNICSINTNSLGKTKMLSEEPGIVELKQLYLDDNYDYSNGTFTGMSENTENQFKKDLQLFYTAFTGNKEMPADIKKFGDIKLRDYNSRNSCQGDATFKKSYKLSKTDKLFVNYADNIKKMIQTASAKQQELLSVINEVFSFVIDPHTSKKKVRVNPKLTDEMLQKLIESTRTIIMELYVKCETDYVNGIKLYEAIVESKILETTQKQINTLSKESDKIIQSNSYTNMPRQQNSSINTPIVSLPIQNQGLNPTSSSVSSSDITPLYNRPSFQTYT
jgi:hypothetical protein